MIRLFTDSIRDSKRGVLVAFFLLFLVLTILSGQLVVLALSSTIIGSILIAFQFPIITVIAFLLLAVWPNLFAMTPVSINLTLGGGILAGDAVMLAMVGAICLQLFINRGMRGKIREFIGFFIFLFTLWILYEIIRNVPTYGLSAPGEFRFRYLILVVPVYIGLFFQSNQKRRRLFLSLIFSALAFPLLVVPIVGALKGWSVGPSNRFFPASISLGLVYGLIALFIARKYKMIEVEPIFIWIICIPVLFLVLVDSHRSVWVTGLVALVVLIWLKEVRLRAILRYIPLALLVGSIVFAVATSAGLDVPAYVTARASEIFAPDATDGTAAWRLNKWNIEMESFKESPFQGIGFGGYWITGVSPHSLYVQTLVKLGAVGALLYIVIILCLFFRLFGWIKAHRKQAPPEFAIVVVAFSILIAGHAFYTVYAFEEYTWLFVGLGMAAVSNKILL